MSARPSVSVSSVLLEFPSNPQSETRLSVTINYQHKAPTPEACRKAAVGALRAGLEELEAKEGASLGFSENSKEMRRVQSWSVSGTKEES